MVTQITNELIRSKESVKVCVCFSYIDILYNFVLRKYIYFVKFVIFFTHRLCFSLLSFFFVNHFGYIMSEGSRLDEKISQSLSIYYASASWRRRRKFESPLRATLSLFGGLKVYFFPLFDSCVAPREIFLRFRRRGQSWQVKNRLFFCLCLINLHVLTIFTLCWVCLVEKWFVWIQKNALIHVFITRKMLHNEEVLRRKYLICWCVQWSW